MNPERESWTPEERRALEAWTGAVPSAGFADRAAEAAVSPVRIRSWPWAAAAAVFLIGFGAAAGSRFARAPSPSMEAGTGVVGGVERRTSVRLGARGVLVAEPGAEATWRVGADGRARVHQVAGNIFYRVDPGGPFVVETPAGTVRVTGTCFRIEVRPMNAFPAAFLGGAAGAALAGTLVTVSVSEGAVVTESAGGPSVVRAGEVGTLRTAATPAHLVVSPEASKTQAAALAASETELLDTLPEALKAKWNEVLKERASLRSTRDRLERELRDSQEKLAAAEREARAEAFFDLDEGMLGRMADECELRFDHLALTAQPPSMNAEKMERLEITPEEKAAADEVFAQHHGELLATIRKIYTEVTGDPDTGSLAPNAMASEINDKVPVMQIQQAFQQLALERAGRVAAPADPEAGTPVLRLYRAFQTSGDRLEAQMAERLGPDFAHRYRRLDKGWGSKRRGSYGCPGDQP